MGVVKKVLGSVAGPVLGFVLGGTKGAIQGLGNAATAFFGGPLAVAVSVGATLLSTKPKAPGAMTASVDRLNVSIDLRTPRKMAIGHTAFATDLRDQEWSADQTYLDRFILAASHKVSSISEIWFDDKLAWTIGGGVQSAFAGYLTVTPVLEGTAGNAINTGPRMGGTRRYTGCAYVRLRYKLTGNDKKSQSPFASSIPSRMTIIGDGIPVYDPRLDSTVGGSGPQRANDQSTWVYTPAAGRNAALGLLVYLLGWRIKNPATGAMKLAVGKGIAPARINLASFIVAANICDETVAIAAGGSEPRYRADGVLSEGDDLSLVLDNFKAAMNATVDDVDGKLRLSILYNDLAAPIGSLTTSDVIGDFQWNQSPPLQDTINLIRWSYTDPSTASLFQMVDGPEVSIGSPDGIERSQTVPLALVQSPSQGQRVIKLRLQRALFPGTFQATFQATAWKFQKGDVIRFTFATLGFSAKLFRIVDMTIQVDGTVPMVLREEHPVIYSAANDNAAVIVGTAPTTYNPLLSPIVQDLSDLNTNLDATIIVVDATVIKVDAVSEKADANAIIIAAQKARVDTLNNTTIPAINEATRIANERIDAARQLVIDEQARAEGKEGQLDQRIDAVAANGTYDDTAVKASIEEVRSAYVDADIGFAEKITTLEASSRPGGNLIPNTSLTTLDGWAFTDFAGGSLMALNAAGTPWMLGGVENNLTLYNAGDKGDGLYSEAQSAPFAVTPGSTLQFYAYAMSHRARHWVSLYWYNSAGAIVGYAGEHLGDRVYEGGQDPNAWEITGLKAIVVPANAVAARMLLRQYVSTRETDRYSWFSRPFVGEVQPGRDSWVPYSAGSDRPVTNASRARIANVETAVTDGRFATAQRASSIEASVGEVGGRATALETITSNGTFATSQRAEQIASYAGSIESKVDIQAGTIAGLGVRQAAYWRVLAVAGNNRAQLTVSADANGGAGIDIVGDVSIAGNLIVDGTILTRGLALNAVTAMVGAQTGATAFAYGNNGTFYGVSVTLPDPTGGPVRVDFRYSNVSGGPGAGSFGVQIQRVLPDGSTYDFSDASYIGGIILDYPPAGASVTYRFKFLQQGSAASGGSMNVLYQQLFAVALKR